MSWWELAGAFFAFLAVLAVVILAVLGLESLAGGGCW